ncbi:MAG: ATP-grasp domain-containing protein [Candidatus Pacebacteria bacterium]|nr:ATP-grasp domain-containing protein [Candidatus Paceibacterota bacterium]
MKNKNIILIVSKTPVGRWAGDLSELKKNFKGKLKIAVLYAGPLTTKKQKEGLGLYDYAEQVNFDSPASITKALLPIKDNLLAITTRSESNIPILRKTLPFVPYLKTPTGASLYWSTDKLEMRRRFKSYDKGITPKYMRVSDAKKETLRKVEKNIGFPLIVKPSGLALSLLVTKVHDREELDKTLKTVFKKIKTLNKDFKEEEPRVMVEQFMEGTLYSIDAYVNSRGVVYFCPIVSVKTGIEAGFDDFFGYQQMTPTKLKKSSIENAHSVTEKSIHALGLRSTTAHVELMRTEEGWKVIEVGPRIGGFRDHLYKLSYGIDHPVNDVLIRIPRKPKVPKKVLGHSATFKLFPRKSGVITTLKGVKKVKELKSFDSIVLRKKVGDRVYPASQGGRSVFEVTLFNKERPRLLADIRKMEKMIEIQTVSRKAK